MSAPANVPAPFQPHSRRSPLTDPWEPLFSAVDGTSWRLGLVIDTPHCNARGMPHGGLIAALSDNAMGLSFGLAHAAAFGTPIKGIVTLSLTVDFLATGQVGDWMEVRPKVLKAGRSTGFVEAHVFCKEVLVSRASATFKALSS